MITYVITHWYNAIMYAIDGKRPQEPRISLLCPQTSPPSAFSHPCPIHPASSFVLSAPASYFSTSAYTQSIKYYKLIFSTIFTALTLFAQIQPFEGPSQPCTYVHQAGAVLYKTRIMLTTGSSSKAQCYEENPL